MANTGKKSTAAKKSSGTKKTGDTARKRAPADATASLKPPKGGAIVRMYRIGHGDCFLIAFDGDERPVNVLIDCGYKPGSPDFIKTAPDEVVADLRKVTGGHLDVAVITHEHQDHVNAITKARFKDFTIGETWFAWTESEDDKLAKALRRKHNDRLKALAMAVNRLRMSAARQEAADRISEFISLEIGGEARDLNLATGGLGLAAGGAWTNKDAMKLFRDISKKPARCIYPHDEIISLPGASKVRVFPLGPPHDEDAIGDLDPHGSESFPQHAMAGRDAAPTFAMALAASLAPDSDAGQPFSLRHGVKLAELAADAELLHWFSSHCGKGDEPEEDTQNNSVPANAKFRRIDEDWLDSAEQLALAMGNDTNNASLVLAFELGRGGKVLLFAGDAQRGNWASWAEKSFCDGKTKIDVKELLGRTVLYKVGHHGSHNATLAGTARDSYPNLGWFGRGAHARELTAMITAVRKWAMQPKIKWDHPLKAIKDALTEQCGGRVFQTDTDFDNMKRPEGASNAAWAAFLKRASGGPLYFDLVIEAD